jgi:hypothetical protein
MLKSLKVNYYTFQSTTMPIPPNYDMLKEQVCRTFNHLPKNYEFSYFDEDNDRTKVKEATAYDDYLSDCVSKNYSCLYIFQDDDEANKFIEKLKRNQQEQSFNIQEERKEGRST